MMRPVACTNTGGPLCCLGMLLWCLACWSAGGRAGLEGGRKETAGAWNVAAFRREGRPAAHTTAACRRLRRCRLAVAAGRPNAASGRQGDRLDWGPAAGGWARHCEAALGAATSAAMPRLLRLAGWCGGGLGAWGRGAVVGPAGGRLVKAELTRGGGRGRQPASDLGVFGVGPPQAVALGFCHPMCCA